MTRHLFITGCSSGLGKALKEHFLRKKEHEVYGFSRRGQTEQPHFHFIQKDLSKVEELEHFSFREQMRSLKDEDEIVLVNNAAQLGEMKRMGDLSAASIRQSIQLNLIAPMMLSNTFIREFREHKGKKMIINIGSGAATNAQYDGWSLYGSSKAGLQMFSRLLQTEQALVKENPVAVYDIAPGVLDSPMQEEIRRSDAQHFRNKDRFVALFEQQQLYPPEKVAEKLASYIENPETIPAAVSRIEL